MQDNKEQVVVEYIQGAREVPAYLRAMVVEYNRLAKIADECVSYPRSVDKKMDMLYDALGVLVK